MNELVAQFLGGVGRLLQGAKLFGWKLGCLLQGAKLFGWKLGCLRDFTRRFSQLLEFTDRFGDFTQRFQLFANTLEVLEGLDATLQFGQLVQIGIGRAEGFGSLSSYYMWGMTPVSEGIIQARGQGGERQAPNDLVLVTGNGGILNYQAALLLSPEAA